MARSRLLGALLALLALLAVPVLTAPAALAAPTADPADAAAGWLARQLVEGERFEQDFGDGMVYPDAGLTLDAVLAFTAAGSAGSYAEDAMGWLGEGTNLAEYAGDGTSFSDAGRLAKVAYAELVTGGEPTDVGGVDVLARLTAQLGTDGRFSDTPAPDASNAFGQSFAVLALARTDGGVPGSAVGFLAGSQCPDGGFPLNYGQPACVSDTDATAMVVQALSVRRGDPAAAARGLEWLVRQQGTDGSFSGTGTTAAPNSNSTGLAAQALRAGGETAAADKAAAWLRTLQAGCSADAAVRGAIAYDGSGFDPGNGVRATAQAVLGLSGVGLVALDLGGAVPDAPTLECAAGPGGSPSPTVSPTGSPTVSPTASPTASPTGSPTVSPTVSPTASPTGSPTASPRPSATVAPVTPTAVPTTTVAPVLPVLPPPTVPAAAGRSLPNTGADVLPLLWLGVGLVVAGGGAAVAARRRP